MRIFDLTGPEFLSFYLSLLAAGGITCLLLRQALRFSLARRGAPTDAELMSLRPEEAAYLAGGAEQAVQAAVASLAQRNLVDANSANHTFVLKAAPPNDAETLERALGFAFGKAPRTVRSLTADARPYLAKVRKRLIELGLILPDETAWMPILVPALVAVLIILVGMIKIFVGISRNRPVGILVILVILSVFFLVQMWKNPPERTVQGDRALKRLRAKSVGLEMSVKSGPERLAPSDLALAVGIFGPAIITSGALSAIGMSLTPRPVVQRSGSWSSDSGFNSCGTSSCGSSCGGGCGGGCGGCGS